LYLSPNLLIYIYSCNNYTVYCKRLGSQKAL